MNDADENQFIVPPPGIKPKPSQDNLSEPQTGAPSDLINLPPGVVDSGTYKMPASRPVTPARLDDAPAFFPISALGLPPAQDPGQTDVSAPSAHTEPDEQSAARVEPPHDAVDDATRVSIGRRGTPVWRFALPDGQEVVIAQTMLIGRDPSAGTHWPEATLLAVDDAAKSVSKTHAALEITAGGQLQVHDLNSTNGVFLRHPETEEIVVEPGHPELVEPGTVLEFGEFAVVIHRN